MEDGGAHGSTLQTLDIEQEGTEALRWNYVNDGVVAEMGRLGSKWFGRESPELHFGQAKFKIPPVPSRGEGEWAVGYK